MAERGSYALGPRLDIQQLLIEAKHRWLRPAEICEILRNYPKFHIASEPPDRPPSGSLFLFDRKVLRYFRKDGHKWRKKKDGKTVKEAHEKLKVGSIDVLHCYYAHGEENENFQRRSYWMLEEDLMHIVFVHYLEVKGNRTNVGAAVETDEVSSSSQKSSPRSSSYSNSQNQAASENADSPSPTSTLTSFCEDADNEDTYQATSRFHSFPTSPKMVNGLLVDKRDAGLSNFYFPHSSSGNVEGWSSVPAVEYVSQVQNGLGGADSGTLIDSQKTLSSASWEEILQQCSTGFHTVPSHVLDSSIEPSSTGIDHGHDNLIPGKLLAGNNVIREDYGSTLTMTSNWQVPSDDNILSFSKGQVDQLPDLYSAYNTDIRLTEQKSNGAIFGSAHEIFSAHPGMENVEFLSNNLQLQFKEEESSSETKLSCENDMSKEGNISYSLTLKQSLLDREESLKKVDSFSRWMTKELVEVDDLRIHSSSGLSWSTEECGNMVDDSSLSPSLSEDQLFSITDFSPKWTFADLETEVVIVGKFLATEQGGTKCYWSCMFGEVEVPAEVLADGILCCHSPPHSVGRVPFYVTCSNRLACSEVREFDYLAGSAEGVDVADIYNSATNELFMHSRFERLLSLRSCPPNDLSEGALENGNLIRKLISLKEEEDCNGEERSFQIDHFQHQNKEYLFGKLMKEKFYSWLIRKVTEEGKGPNILDDKGQGVIHLAAALGYDWAMRPIVIAGVSINFRDANGWTALHWAAFCGREQTVAILISLGAGPGLLTDPSPEYPLGRTPADLASANGHKGISGFLAESSLTSYLVSLTMTDSKEDGVLEITTRKAVHTVSERMATPINDGFMPAELSMKDSLTAVCNATQAADRIHQMFRLQSFQRKQISECSSDEFGSSDENAIAFVAARRACKPGPSNGFAHAAAVQIQKKFRGWRMRKEFLLIRQRIVKIQAHVRGHQVRKQYRKIVWSVGILDKIILRWRRKGSGLRGFRPDALPKEPTPQIERSNEDDYDFLKKGRRQTEERLQKALTRVKSMAQYPEGRDQYRRLLTVVQKCRETKVSNLAMSSSSEEIMEGDDMIDIDTLLDDDALMSITFD